LDAGLKIDEGADFEISRSNEFAIALVDDVRAMGQDTDKPAGVRRLRLAWRYDPMRHKGGLDKGKCLSVDADP
jgi:hypothetical protein